MSTPATDVHQHLWPEPLVEALARRRREPCVRRDGRGWRMRLAGETDSPFGPATHDPVQRLRSARAAGLERVLVCSSLPLGLEALREDEARPLLAAWHAGVRDAGPGFDVWGAVPLDGGTPTDVDGLLDDGAIGVALPAGALAGPRGVDAAGPLLERLEARGAPLLVHPGAAPADAPSAAPAAWWPALTRYVADMHDAWHAWVAWGRPAHPRLRVCFAMLAGLAPLHGERLAARGGPPEALSDPLAFYDTSSYGPRAWAAMAAAVGPDQLVFGSDRPVVDAVPPDDVEGIGREALVRSNVARLLTGASA
jgi:6-methylsalicylate decarboxylase